MTQGISQSLNLTLMRLNSIENNFRALENISKEMSSINSPSIQNQKSDFKTILDAKIGQNEENKEVQNAQNIENTEDIAPLDEDLNISKKDSINLKSKIDLNSQINDVDEIIQTFADKYDVDSNFIKAIIKQESGFNPNATSKKGAMGLMQLMPQTAKSLGVINAYNPWENVEGGVKHLKSLLNTYKGNKELTLAAYNAGSGAVKKYGGIPPYKETQNYVSSIMASYNKLNEVSLW